MTKKEYIEKIAKEIESVGHIKAWYLDSDGKPLDFLITAETIYDTVIDSLLVENERLKDILEQVEENAAIGDGIRTELRHKYQEIKDKYKELQIENEHLKAELKHKGE